jgi:hypothetical protein
MLVAGWTEWRTCALMIGLFVVPVWVLVLLPLYVLLPRTSFLWRPATCTGLGAISGALLVTLYFAVSPDVAFGLVVLFLPFSIIIGGVICFIGGLILAPFFLLGALAGREGFGGGIAFAVMFPVIYAVGGFLGGIIGAALYNLVAKWTGGLEFEVADAALV